MIGRFIPKGTIVIANVWQLNRDPEIHEDAARFNPARYLDAGECVGGDEKEESHIMYGFGRRVCVGQYLANNSLLMAFAMMLWAVNFERHLDADGKPTPLEMDDCIDEGTLMCVVPPPLFFFSSPGLIGAPTVVL